MMSMKPIISSLPLHLITQMMSMKPIISSLPLHLITQMMSMCSTSNVENLSPQVIRQIAREISDLSKEPPEGIKIFPNEADITDIRASIEGPAGTPYAGGMFKLKLVLGKNYPSEPPRGFFMTKIFHPNVASNGEICVNTLKKDWKADLGIKQVLLTVKCLLIVPNPESALNEEAGKLLLEQYDDYSMRAKIFTEIHAKPPKVCLEESSKENVSEGPVAKRHAGDKLVEKRKKAGDSKKKVLKRL